MDTYLPALIWLLSAISCKAIAIRRLVKTTAWFASAVTVLGPFAIPLMWAASPSTVMACAKAVRRQ